MTSDGEEQVHPVHNVFNILGNKGFLRGEEGINTLEAVQMFYKEIGVKARKPTLINENLFEKDVLESFPMGKSIPQFKAVITLVKKNSNNEDIFHAVRCSQLFVGSSDKKNYSCTHKKSCRKEGKQSAEERQDDCDGVR